MTEQPTSSTDEAGNTGELATASALDADAPADDAADGRVTDAVRRLDTLPEDQPAEHVAIYEDVHATLQEALAEAADRDRDEAPDHREPPGTGGAGS